jgi:diacylglycerol kinase family enzyme
MDMHKKSSEFDAAVIVNAAAGQGCSSSWATDLANQFSSCGIKAKITLAKNGDEIQAAAQSAIDAGISVLVAGGGDGTTLWPRMSPIPILPLVFCRWER